MENNCRSHGTNHIYARNKNGVHEEHFMLTNCEITTIVGTITIARKGQIACTGEKLVFREQNTSIGGTQFYTNCKKNIITNLNKNCNSQGINRICTRNTTLMAEKQNTSKLNNWNQITTKVRTRI